MKAKAEILGRRHAKNEWLGKDRYYTWLMLPTVWPGRILTMVKDGEEWLPYGTWSADAILVDVDPKSLRHDGAGYTADIEVLDVWTNEEGEAEAG